MEYDQKYLLHFELIHLYFLIVIIIYLPGNNELNAEGVLIIILQEISFDKKRVKNKEIIIILFKFIVEQLKRK